MDGNTLQTHPDDSSLFLCLVTGLTDAPRSLQTDTWRRTWAPLTGSCRDSTVLTRGVILDPQVSAWPGVAVPGNVMFKFFFFNVSEPIERPGRGTTSRTFNHALNFLLLHSVAGRQSLSEFMLKSCTAFPQ